MENVILLSRREWNLQLSRLKIYVCQVVHIGVMLLYIVGSNISTFLTPFNSSMKATRFFLTLFFLSLLIFLRLSGFCRLSLHRAMSGRKRGRPSKAEERLASRAPVKISKAALWLRVASIHEAIMAHEFSWPFNQPVDPEQLNLPSYHIIVKHPMDLGTIKVKCHKAYIFYDNDDNENCSIDQVIFGTVQLGGRVCFRCAIGELAIAHLPVHALLADCLQVWQNCIAFNDKNSELSEMCIDVASFFEWLFVNQISHCIVDPDEEVKRKPFGIDHVSI